MVKSLSNRPWSCTVGPLGVRVTARERVFGGPVYLYAYDRALRGRRKRALGFRVRDAAGGLISEHVAQAKRHALELSNRLIRGAGPAVQTTIGQLFAVFEREVVPRERPKTQEETRRGLALWRAFLGEGFVLSRLGLREWNTFIAARQAGEMGGRGQPVKPTKRRPVRPRTVARSLKLLRQTCRFGATYRTITGAYLLENDPTRGLPVPVENNPRRPVADTTRFESLLAVADRVMMLDAKGELTRSYLPELLVLAEGTGRRIGSILALRWSDWAPDVGAHGTIRWRAEHDKVGQDWTTPVTPRVRDALEAARRYRPGVGDALLFSATDDPSRPVTRHVAAMWLHVAERLAGLEPLKGGVWHPFRRAWASKRKHLSLKDVAYAGGWKDTSTLLKCYQQPDPETIEEVVLGPRELRLAR